MHKPLTMLGTGGYVHRDTQEVQKVKLGDNSENLMTAQEFQLFDTHLHIIDKRYPLVQNNGYLPEEFTCAYSAPT